MNSKDIISFIERDIYKMGYKELDKESPIANSLYQFYSSWINSSEATEIIEDSSILIKGDIVVVIYEGVIDVFDVSSSITLLSSPELMYSERLEALIRTYRAFGKIKGNIQDNIYSNDQSSK